MKTYCEINKDNIHIVVLNLSGLYTKIEEEFWCPDNELLDRLKGYEGSCFQAIRIEA